MDFEAVRDSDEQTRFVADHVPVLIAYVDREQCYRRVNRAYEEWFGRPRAQIVGCSVQALVGDSHYANARPYLARALGGERVSYESQAPKVGEGMRDVAITYVPDVAPDGCVRGFVALVQDVTDRKRVERALRESEEQFRTLANTIPNLAWTALADGHIDWYNRRWYEYTGTTPAQMEGWGWQSVHDPVVLPDVLARWTASIASGQPFEMVFPLRGADGVFRPFLTRVEPLRDAQGGVTRWFGTNTDIEQQQQAQRTAELLNGVGPMLAAELDLQTLAQKVTDVATQLTGAQFGALYRTTHEAGNSFTLFTLSGAPRERFAHFPLLHNAPSFTRQFPGDAAVRSDDITEDARFRPHPNLGAIADELLPMRSYLGVPVISRSGEALGALVFGHAQPAKFTVQHEQLAAGVAAQAAIALDNARLFLESQRAREALARSNADLRRANNDLEQFAYSASHDLQEPLRMVSVYTQMLERDYRGRLDARAQEYFAYVVEGARRMERLIRDLLAYTRAAGLRHEHVASLSASAALHLALANLRGALLDAGAHIDSGPLPDLLVEEVHLLQLFQNLIGNALKYRRADPPVIRISAEPDGPLWRLCVRDNGIGIDPRYAEQVFGLFKRLHEPGKYEGTGLGLAICQKIVQRYGGRIWVESEGEGRGSAFFFTLPGVGPPTPVAGPVTAAVHPSLERLQD